MTPLRIVFDKGTDTFVLTQVLDALHGKDVIVATDQGGRVACVLGHEHARVVEDHWMNYTVNGVPYAMRFFDMAMDGEATILVM